MSSPTPPGHELITATASRPYDVALSFAGEDREYVDQVANHLRRAGVVSFYDKYEQVDLWGKDLYEHLSDVYRNQARYTVMFVSRHYAEKLWPRHERRSAQARAFREAGEYVLPVRFDDTEVPGLPETVGYLDLRTLTPAQLSEAICQKLVRAGVALTPAPTLPSGEPGPAASPSHVTISVRAEDGSPLADADVLLVAADGTHLQARTDAAGSAHFTVSKRRALTIYCARRERPAFMAPEYDPVADLQITLPAIPGVGSLVSVGGWDTIPGLHGTVNSIHDSQRRLYVYTQNIAVNGGWPQPVNFAVGVPLRFEDVHGNARLVTYVAVVGPCFLIEHRTTTADR